MLCLRPIIRPICLPWSPVNSKLPLTLTVAQPVQPHVHGFEAFCLNVVVDDALCCAVVCLQRRAWLRMAHFEEDLAIIRGFASVDV